MRGVSPSERLFSVALAGGIVFTMALGGPTGAGAGAAPPTASRCQLTLGAGGDPFYKPNAPLRSHVGTGFVLSGIVRSGIDCAAMPGARVEFWLRAADGQYDDLHRGIVVTDGGGRYRIESNFPGGGDFLAPHIHLRVAVPGYKTLATVFLPRAGTTAGTFDLVLEPEV